MHHGVDINEMKDDWNKENIGEGMIWVVLFLEYKLKIYQN